MGSPAPAGSNHPAPPRQRAITVLLAAASAIAIWVFAVPIAGTDLIVTIGGEDTRQEVGIAAVTIMSLVIGLAAWGLLAILERFTARAVLIWRIIAVIVLLGSFGGPAAAQSGGATITLALMHLFVGAILIVLLPRGARR